MSNFSYRAMNPHGHTVRGRMEAANLDDLELRLRRLGLDLLHANPVRQISWQRQRRISRRELINFCFHLEQFLRAGVPIIDSLADLRDSLHRARFRQVIGEVVEAIEGGLCLSQALQRHPDVFNGVFCSLVRAGEHTGRLPEVLAALTDTLKRDDELAAYARRIAIYPALVALVISAALGVALVHVVPELARLFQSAGQVLPWQTRILIALSGFVIDYGWLLVLGGISGLLLARHALSTRPATNYRYKVENIALGFNSVYPRNSSLTDFRLKWAPGVQFATTYSISVAAFVGGIWGPYGAACPVTVGPFPSTQLSDCATVLPAMSTAFTCVPVTGASNYQYRFTNTALSYSCEAYRNNSSTDYGLTWLPASFAAQYSTTYNVEVRALVGGICGTYGNVCTITTPSAPLTSLQPSFCSNYALPTFSSAVNCVALAGASNYRYKITGGIMDQMISAGGKAGQALLIDCRSLATELVPLTPGTVVVVLDTATRRGLVASAYNERRAQCHAAAQFFQVSALRDVTLAQFAAREQELDELTRCRARHVITENERTVAAAAATDLVCIAGSIFLVGDLLNRWESLQSTFALTRD